MNNRKKIVIIGATSSIAHHCARLWVQKEPIELILVGRNARKLKRVERDLQVYGPSAIIRLLQSEMIRPEDINKIAISCSKEQAADIVLIAHGMQPDQKRCQSDLQYNCSTLCVNGISPALFTEAFASGMRYGTIAVIGSIAGDRGRRSDYVTGAAKGLITRYVQGLQHRIAGEKGNELNVLLIKPGPTATPMSTEIQETGAKLTPVQDVAKDIVQAIENKKRVLYTPSKWRAIMHIVQHLPEVIFNHVNA